MMTNAQLYIAIGLPVIAVLASLVVYLVQISGIKEDMRGLRKDVMDEIRDWRKKAREDRLQIAGKIDLLTGTVCEMMGQK